MSRIGLLLLAIGLCVTLLGCGAMDRASPPLHPPTAVGGDMFPLGPCDRSGDENAR